jgi:hypothetical protein
MLSYLVLLLITFSKEDQKCSEEISTAPAGRAGGWTAVPPAAAVSLWHESRTPQLCAEPKIDTFPSLPFLTHLKHNETFCLQKTLLYSIAHKIIW